MIEAYKNILGVYDEVRGELFVILQEDYRTKGHSKKIHEEIKT